MNTDSASWLRGLLPTRHWFALKEVFSNAGHVFNCWTHSNGLPSHFLVCLVLSFRVRVRVGVRVRVRVRVGVRASCFPVPCLALPYLLLPLSKIILDWRRVVQFELKIKPSRGNVTVMLPNLMCLVLCCLVLSCLVLSCFVLFVLSCLVLSCVVLSCLVLLSCFCLK